ncbi:hypothetical protein kpv79_44 [Klebsiella phage vB_KpnM_KpV79]|uniref:Uncharacterized protein n=1 Tax=Klebsiella phage vB_KpnM_KpV79 TaxID=2041212 RepID=A0A291LCK2_9CAUD|nr:hypothetical protein FDI70_gp44 [Klebsiella phage vB_KpnM_KpV79]ATI16497.1 hypothetical protein kpv79_44 [Klebsiella phage vB_KpnM_KpV79]
MIPRESLISQFNYKFIVAHGFKDCISWLCSWSSAAPA